MTDVILLVSDSKATTIMKSLMASVKIALANQKTLPFSSYSSIREQHLLNVPIIKPLLIFVLAGEKRVGQSSEGICQSGEFIFLPNKTTIDMRNIPGSREYYALLIEFDYTDFQGIQYDAHSRKNFCLGTTTPQLAMVVQQFVEWSCFAPAMLWPSRRQELVHYLYYLGYHDIPSMINHPETSHRVHAIISHNLSNDISTDSLCIQLAMSESTLRRRLKAEGTNLQNIKDQARLGHGLHLLQTTLEPIGHIAEQCGYQSQSRFTDRFKQRFGLTPTELRKTRMND